MNGRKDTENYKILTFAAALAGAAFTAAAFDGAACTKKMENHMLLLTQFM
jgi:hypothetical protein